MSNVLIPRKLLNLVGEKLDLSEVIAQDIAAEEANGLQIPVTIEAATAFEVSLGTITSEGSFTGVGLTAENDDWKMNIGIISEATQPYTVLEAINTNSGDSSITTLTPGNFLVVNTTADGSVTFELSADAAGGLTLTGDSSFVVTDSRDTTVGITYAADYSAEFSTRSLVDKGYVTTNFTPIATSGTSVPGTTPSAIGLFYVKTDTGKLYVSVGTSSSSDWVILN